MEFLKRIMDQKVLNWGVSSAFLLLLLPSCSVIKHNGSLKNKMYGGYESMSFNTENDRDNIAHIYGNVVEGTTKKKVVGAHVAFLTPKGDVILDILTNENGDFEAMIDKQDIHYGSIEIDGNESGILTISNVDFGTLYHNTKIKARLQNFDQSISEKDISSLEDIKQLKREIKEMKKKKNKK